MTDGHLMDEFDEHGYVDGEQLFEDLAGIEFLKVVFGDKIDLNDDHHKETLARFVKMLRELTTPCELKWKTFPSESDEMVVVKNIPFSSLCAHHIVPFVGVAHVGYIPQGQIAGLSKFARVVKHFAADLQVQETLTTDIADYLEAHLDPVGVAVVLEAEHLCMSIRGIQVPGTRTVTSSMKGAFADHTKQARAEFLGLIKE